ncbi:unnamed protein product [Urochloa humidicola]
MDRAKGSTSGSAVGDIPEGPLVDILSRVPAKSVCRFKCVSKAWLDLITDPHHWKKLPQAMQGLFCQISKKSEAGQPYRFSFVDLAARSVPLDIDPSFSFLTEQPGIRFLRLRDSCNGLVLFEHHEEWGSARLGHIVCNPTTKEWKAVPACGSPTSLTFPYLAFDPAVSSHFNLFQFLVEEDDGLLSFHAYSSETGGWNENQVGEQAGDEEQFQGWQQVRFNLVDPNPRYPFVNGFLHLIVLDQDQIKIVALDVEGKARRMIPVPHVADWRRWMCYFGESQGQLHYMTQEMFYAHGRKYKFSIWVLKDYDAQDWALKGTVNTNVFFGENNGRGGTEGFRVVEDIEVAEIHQHRNVVFFTCSSVHRWLDAHQDNSVNFVTRFS